MSQNISIDPVSRIPGHCRAELELDGQSVRRASIGGTMWRGVERVIAGKPVDDAWLYAQRICGTCAPSHAIASIRAAENAYGVDVALNAQLIRNAMIAAHAVGDHVVTFYQRALPDWVSTAAAIAADPATAATLARTIAPGSPLNEAGLRRLQTRLRGDATRGGTAPFRGPSGHGNELDPSHSLVLLGHAEAAQRIVRAAGAAMATLAGKLPHVQNLAIGGVATAVSLDDPTTLNMRRLQSLRALFDEMAVFVADVFLRDVAALAAAQPEWLRPRAPMTVLALPEMPTDAKSSVMELPGGSIAPGGRLVPIDAAAIAAAIEKMVVSSDHTWQPDREPGEAQYSWARTVRFDGRPAEVGPAAQVMVARAAGHGPTERWFRELSTLLVARSGPVMETSMLQSPLGRHAARGVRAAVMAELGLKQVTALLENIGRGDVAVRIAPGGEAGSGSGVGIYESPQGALVHTLTVADRVVGEYRVISPGNWNAGPRAADGSAGPCESSLVGTVVADAAQPVEVLRTLHSFAPCMSCASA